VTSLANMGLPRSYASPSWAASRQARSPKTEAVQVAALKELLDRGCGYGKPTQLLSGEDTTSAVGISSPRKPWSAEIIERMERRATAIDGHAEPGKGTAEPAPVRDLLTQPLPTD
jgi:hypothetical protein